MVDARTHECHLGSVVDQSAALKRGDVVAAPAGMMVIWSHDATHLSGFMLTRTGKIEFGRPPVSVARAGCVRCGRLSETEIAKLPAVIAYLRRSAAVSVEYQEGTEAVREFMSVGQHPYEKRGNGHDYWDGERFADGCRWIRYGGNGSSGER